MNVKPKGNQAIIFCTLFILVSSALACDIPISWVSGGNQEPQDGGGIPAAVSTQVAATLYAQVAVRLTSESFEAFAIQTQLALVPSPSATEKSVPTTVVKPATLTISPAAEIAVLPTAISTLPDLPPPPPPPPLPPEAQVTLLPGQPPQGYGPILPPDYQPIGEVFDIVGVSLASCGSQRAISLLIYNAGDIALESLTLSVFDQANGQLLLDPSVSDSPFYTNELSCSSGDLQRLDPGQALYTGGPLLSLIQSGHMISTQILICTENEMHGSCYNGAVEFIAP